MNIVERGIIRICTLFNVNLLQVAFEGIGISDKYHTLDSSFFINLLRPRLADDRELVFFDVGANVGEVTRLMLDHFSALQVHAFEPNPHSFVTLQKAISDRRATLNNSGLGQETKDSVIFYDQNENTTSHATLFRSVYDLHGVAHIGESPVKLITLDEYCASNKIERIDFLKIDTEGNELNVLRGASRMLSTQRVNVIQFEFNEMNVISKAFLKDFYDILPGYDFYRIKKDKLFPLGKYSSSNEIFRMQNLLALKKNQS